MEELVVFLSQSVSRIAQLFSIFIIVSGIIKVFWLYTVNIFKSNNVLEVMKESRAELGYSFSVGLGILIGSSILRSVIAPTWNDIGQLAAIIGIRTVLNYFLTKDIMMVTGKDPETNDSKCECKD